MMKKIWEMDVDELFDTMTDIEYEDAAEDESRSFEEEEE